MLYFVRHGETNNNFNYILGGDSQLTAKGKRQAEQTAERLKNIHFDKIFVSNLIRTQQTAEIVNKYHNKQLIIDKRIRERYYGNHELLDESKMDMRQYWDLNCEKLEPENVESIQEVTTRVKSFFDEIKTKYKGQNILVVSHRGVGRIMQLINGIVPPSNNLFDDGLQNGEYYIYEI